MLDRMPIARLRSSTRLTRNSARAYDFCFPKSSLGIYVCSTFAEVMLGYAGNYGKEAAGDV